MGLLSIGIGNDAIRFSREGVILGMVPLNHVSAEGLAVFKRTNYDLQGSAGYQQFLEGALCGLTLAYGPPIPTSVEISASEAEQLLNAEVMTEPAKELHSIDASEVGTVEDVLLDPRPLPGQEIIVPGYTVHDGVVVGSVPKTAATQEIEAAKSLLADALPVSDSPDAAQ